MSSNKFRPLIFAVSVLGVSLVHASDEPDLQRENRMHEIYKNYNSAPTDSGLWQNAKEKSKQKSYQIQSGDTLWGLSETLFGDPYFWPKLWSVNSDTIENPHEINAQKKIQFEGGNVLAPPQLSVTDATSASKTESPSEEKTEVAVEEVKTEIPKNDSKVVAGKLPGSLPYWKFRNPPSSSEFKTVEVRTKFSEASRKLSYFLSDTDIKKEGIVKETEMGMNTAADYQYIHVKLAADVTTPQKFYLVMQEKEKIKQFGGRGRIVEVQGKIEILDRINEVKNIYRAIVRESLTQIEVDSFLVAQDWITYDKSMNGSISSVDVKLIGGQTKESSVLFGSDHIVYLKGGQAEGVSPGQVVQLYMDLSKRNPDTLLRENHRKAGLVKIINVSEHVSTGVVISSDDVLVPGDFSKGSEIQ